MKMVFSASILRIVLILFMLTVLAVGVAGFIAASNQLRLYAEKVNDLDARASVGNTDLTKLQAIKNFLAENNSIVDKTHAIVADSKSYRYQDEIVKDLTKYASQSGISIVGFSFDSGSADSAGAGAAAPTPAIDQNTISTLLPGGIKSTSVSVSIAEKTPFSGLIRFIQYVETNATKMQIKNISVTHNTSEDADPEAVDPQALQIEVYIR